MRFGVTRPILALVLSVLCTIAVVSASEAFDPLHEGLLPVVAPQTDTGRIIVQFVPGTPANERAAAHANVGGRVVKTIPALGMEVVSVPNANATRGLANAYGRNPNVLLAEPDALVPLSGTAAVIPNDPSLSAQWQHTAIDSTLAWGTTKGGAYRITICDTGVAPQHEDLVGNLETSLGWNTVSNNTQWQPIHWHGTATAGAAAAVGNNGKGVAGAAWTARIIPVRISNRTDGSAYYSDMVDCIVYGADKGSVAINLSYQTYTNGTISSSIVSAADYADSKGSVLVVAAGNENKNPAGTADHANILFVSATDQNNNKASFSNFGPYVDVGAPGVSVVSTYVTLRCRGNNNCSVSQNNQYAYVSGTSFSSPITAGAVVLVKAANPAFTTTQLRAAIVNGACDKGAAGEDIYFGRGLLNSHHAVHSEACPLP